MYIPAQDSNTDSLDRAMLEGTARRDRSPPHSKKRRRDDSPGHEVNVKLASTAPASYVQQHADITRYPAKLASSSAAHKGSPRPHRKRFRVQKSPVHSSAILAHSSPNSSLCKTGPGHSLLASCHVCHRRPLTKAELSSYGDCEACGRRTCYICLRVCEGTCAGGQRGRTVCSGCCVEKGVEGNVFCLDCLDDGNDGDEPTSKT